MEHGDGGDEEHVDDDDHLADDQMWEVSRPHLVMSPFKASPPPSHIGAIGHYRKYLR